MRFPAKKNAGCPKASRDFPPRIDGILYPRRVVLGLPSPSHRVCADGRTYGCTDVRTYGRADGRSRDYYVTTKISRIDRLPYFLSNGAPLAGFSRRLRYKWQFKRRLKMLVVTRAGRLRERSQGDLRLYIFQFYFVRAFMMRLVSENQSRFTCFPENHWVV